jgi:hypothetical protein
VEEINLRKSKKEDSHGRRGGIMNQAIAALMGVVVGILGSYGGIVLTNRFQVGRERKVRVSEYRMAVFKEVNDLAAEFLNDYLKDPSQYRITDQFYRSLMVTTANIKVSFSQKTFESFKEFEVMIGPNLGPGKGSTEAFTKARDMALRTLYAEAI